MAYRYRGAIEYAVVIALAGDPPEEPYMCLCPMPPEGTIIHHGVWKGDTFLVRRVTVSKGTV